MPIWALPERFETIAAHGGRRLVALSSTSIFTKRTSSDPVEQSVARRLEEGEARLIAWAGSRNIEWVILRPTLIYGFGRDRNVSEVTRFIRRFGFFPIVGDAKGLRQPIHADDVALACLQALQAKHVVNQTYNVSGSEVLAYRDMIARIFDALGKRPRFVRIPLWLFQLGFPVARASPRFRHWSIGMAERMNQDSVFDHVSAALDLGLAPRPFMLQQADLPK